MLLWLQPEWSVSPTVFNKTHPKTTVTTNHLVHFQPQIFFSSSVTYFNLQLASVIHLLFHYSSNEYRRNTANIGIFSDTTSDIWGFYRTFANVRAGSNRFQCVLVILTKLMQLYTHRILSYFNIKIPFSYIQLVFTFYIHFTNSNIAI